jgi:hypothetical protein
MNNECTGCVHDESPWKGSFPCDECSRNHAGEDDMFLSKSEPHIKDSGERREFETGAVRDIQEGKGRCDLLPLDIVSVWLDDSVLDCIGEFQRSGDCGYLYAALNKTLEATDDGIFDDAMTTVLEVAKHFEDGAKKYGEYNWQKGIPIHCYIDSAVRHYLKWRRGDTDEPHDRAFVWNILCCLWTMKNKPEMNDLRKQENENA